MTVCEGEPVRMLLVGEYIRRRPSSATRWIPDLARALAARGHDVTVALGGADDHDELRPIRTWIHNHRRTHTGGDPRAFVRWARNVRTRLAPDACVSFTRLFAGDLCIPLGASSVAYLRTLFRTKSPHSAVFELGHRKWLFPSIWMERRACRGHEGLNGEMTASQGPRLGTLGPARPGAISLGYGSRFGLIDVGARDALGARTRGVLGIAPARPVFLASGAHLQRSGVKVVLEGLARIRAHNRGHAPILLLAGRRSHSLHRMALAAGVEEGVRLLGETARMDAALSACDAALLPAAEAGSRYEVCTGRFAADAFRLGRPVIAHPGAPGAELVGGERPAGLIVAEPTPEGWASALARAADRSWLRGATDAAGAMSGSFGVEHIADRLAEVMGDASRRRAG